MVEVIDRRSRSNLAKWLGCITSQRRCGDDQGHWTKVKLWYVTMMVSDFLNSNILSDSSHIVSKDENDRWGSDGTEVWKWNVRQQKYTSRVACLSCWTLSVRCSPFALPKSSVSTVITIEYAQYHTMKDYVAFIYAPIEHNCNWSPA